MEFTNIKLCTNEAGEVIMQNGRLMAFDLKAQRIIYLPDEKNEREHFNLAMQEKVHENECDTEEVKITGSSKQQASWKNENAVKALISQWKLHEDKFKSTTITNDKVWNMIAAKLIDENPLWEYSSHQLSQHNQQNNQ